MPLFFSDQQQRSGGGDQPALVVDHQALEVKYSNAATIVLKNLEMFEWGTGICTVSADSRVALGSDALAASMTRNVLHAASNRSESFRSSSAAPGNATSESS